MSNAHRIEINCPYEIARIDGIQNSSLSRIIGNYDLNVGKSPLANDKPIWNASFFGLDRASLFSKLPLIERTSLLTQLGRDIIEEAQFIELAGMAYTAKMSLMAEDHHERQLYSFFAADEAQHYRMFTSINGEPNADHAGNNSFLQYLSQIVQTESRGPLMFLSQVILEGWGLTHYANLCEAAENENVKAILKMILADEAKHHGSGLLLFDENSLSKENLDGLENWLEQFFAMIRTGPARVIAALAQRRGQFAESEIYQTLIEMQFATKLKGDLELMRHLMTKSNAQKLLRIFESKNIFAVPDVREMSQKIAAHF